jgi:hypothetical protein
MKWPDTVAVKIGSIEFQRSSLVRSLERSIYLSHTYFRKIIYFVGMMSGCDDLNSTRKKLEAALGENTKP